MTTRGAAIGDAHPANPLAWKSLDGYIAEPDGTFDWSVPSQELHRFHNERVRELGYHLPGRNLYERWSTGRRPIRTRSPDAIELDTSS